MKKTKYGCEFFHEDRAYEQARETAGINSHDIRSRAAICMG
jgi:hypothetical protein